MRSLGTSCFLRMVASLCLLLTFGCCVVCAETASYTFTNYKWETNSVNWSCIEASNSKTDNVLKLEKGNKACGNSPKFFSNITSVTIWYTTNTNTGKGEISVYCVDQPDSKAQAGQPIGVTFSVVAPSSGGTNEKKCSFTPSSPCTGYVQIYATCSENSIYIKRVDIEYEANTPSLTASVSSLDFGSVALGSTETKPFTLNGLNLTSDATLTVEGDAFSVSPTTVSASNGTIADQLVEVTFRPSTSGTYSGSLVVSSADATPLSIALSGEALAAHSVTWSVNGEGYTEGTPTVLVADGQRVAVLPTAPADINNKTFVGWTTQQISPSVHEQPAVLFTSAADAPAVTADVVYYAVFAYKAGNDITYNKLTNDKFNSEGTYVIGAEDGGTTYYFYKVKSGGTWGLMTADPSAHAPMQFKLSGKAGTLYVQNSDGKYLGPDVGKFSLSDDQKAMTLNEKGQLLDCNKRMCIRFNSGADYGIRWYDYSDGNTLPTAYLYEVCGGYSYRGYCTLVSSDPVSGTVALKAHTATGTRYATFSAQHDVVFANDVEVCGIYVKNGKVYRDLLEANDVDVTDDAIERVTGGQYVPANTGVLLKSNADAVTYYFPKTTKTVELAGNLLMPAPDGGGTFEAEAGYIYYKLAYGNYNEQTDLGFYWGAAGGAPFNVKAGTAYLAVPAAASASSGENAKGFKLDDQTDAISHVFTHARDAQIYNLCGQRVNKMDKRGLYVVNGKKIIVGK